jgi:hypothetical protein
VLQAEQFVNDCAHKVTTTGSSPDSLRKHRRQESQQPAYEQNNEGLKKGPKGIKKEPETISKIT